MSVLKICFWNANGVNQHKSEIFNFLSNNNIDVLLLSETHLTNKYNFNIPRYTFHKTNHPDGKAHGGTGILIKSRIKHHSLECFSQNYLQATSIFLDGVNGGLTLTSVYCPPRFSVSKIQFENFFKTLGNRFLACGDYNAKHTYWGSRLINPKGRQLYCALVDRRNGLDVISSGKPTYWPSDPRKIPDLIDFGVTRNIERNNLSTETSFDLSSDHSPVILTYSVIITNSTPCGQTSFKTNWLKYKKYISSHIHIEPLLESEGDIGECIQDFTSIMQSAVEHSTFKSVSYRRTTNVSNAEIESLLAIKRRLRREWQNSRSPAAKQRLSEATRMLRKALHLEEDRINRNYIENLSHKSTAHSSIWKAIKINTPVEGEHPLRKRNGDWARSDLEKAEAFATHLSEVFEPNPADVSLTLPSSPMPPILGNIVFNAQEVEAIIENQIKTRKAPGYDSVTPSMIKNLPFVAVIVLTKLFNAILKIGFFPDLWKISEIKMISKPGKDLTLPSSYRPISLLPCLSKLFEKNFLQKLLPYLESNNIIPAHQFGFREKHGTIEQVNRITCEVRKAFEEKKYCSAVFLDVAQAFDKVWHEGLIYKMRKCLPTSTHKVLESYLKNRYFRVKYKHSITGNYAMNAGVPQGSVLGPILYLIFTSDLPTDEAVLTSTFADDTAIISTHSNPKVASLRLNNHLKHVETWLKKWRMKVNALKSKHVTFALRMDICPPVYLNSIAIPHADKVVYLGIHLDRRLTWRKHIEAKRLQMKLKACQLHWLINHHSKLSLDSKVILYNSILKPIWTYGIQLWGTASISNIELIQRAQSKILRTITGAPWYVRNSNIHRDLNVPLVKDEFLKMKMKYIERLENHPNPLARVLTQSRTHSRLRRADLPPIF